VGSKPALSDPRAGLIGIFSSESRKERVMEHRTAVCGKKRSLPVLRRDREGLVENSARPRQPLGRDLNPRLSQYGL
jgi:hypothetical protein